MKFLLSGIVLLTLFISCKKEAGDGGNSVIKGKVIVRDYNVFPNNYIEKGAADADIFIIYGDDDNAIDDRTRTSYDGSYKFEFLKQGKYRVFIYTEDTALANFGNDKALIFETEIKKNNSEVVLSDIKIFNL